MLWPIQFLFVAALVEAVPLLAAEQKCTSESVVKRPAWYDSVRRLKDRFLGH